MKTIPHYMGLPGVHVRVPVGAGHEKANMKAMDKAVASRYQIKPSRKRTEANIRAFGQQVALSWNEESLPPSFPQVYEGGIDVLKALQALRKKHRIGKQPAVDMQWL